MSLFSLIPLLATFISLLLGIFVLTRNALSRLNWLFFCFSISLAVWNGGIFAMFQVDTAEKALMVAKILHFGVILCTYLFIHITVCITENKLRKYILLIYAIPSLFLVINYKEGFISDVGLTEYSWYGIGSHAFHLFVFIYIFIISILGFNIINKFRKTQGQKRNKYKYLILAKALLLFFGLHDALPVYQIYHYPFTSISIYPLFAIGSTIYGILVAYSVLQHQILNAYTSLGEIAANYFRIVLLVFFYFLCLSIIAFLIPDYFSLVSIFSSTVLFFITLLLGIYFFPKLTWTLEEKLSSNIFGDKFESIDKIKSFANEINLYQNENALLDDLHSILIEVFPFDRYALIVYEQKSNAYKITRVFPRLEGTEKFLSYDSKLISTLINQPKSRLGSYYKSSIPLKGNFIGEHDSSILQKCKICFPFRNGAELVGALFIGTRDKNENLALSTINLCELIAEKLCLFYTQLKLRSEVAKSRDIELLGNISRGLAHDLNNLITPISTYCQLAKTHIQYDPALCEFSTVAERSLQAMQAYIKESLFFSTNSEPQIRQLFLYDLFENLRSLHLPLLTSKNLELVFSYPKELSINADDVLIKRLLSNLIINAIDASPVGQKIELTVLDFNRSFPKRRWVRFSIQDYGVGIPAKEIDKVFTPYFTTKDTGDGKRGSGLGLSICRRIVDLHQGTISIQSQAGTGTRVEIFLPSNLLLTDTNSHT